MQAQDKKAPKRKASSPPTEPGRAHTAAVAGKKRAVVSATRETAGAKSATRGTKASTRIAERPAQKAAPVCERARGERPKTGAAKASTAITAAHAHGSRHAFLRTLTLFARGSTQGRAVAVRDDRTPGNPTVAAPNRPPNTHVQGAPTKRRTALPGGLLQALVARVATVPRLWPQAAPRSADEERRELQRERWRNEAAQRRRREAAAEGTHSRHDRGRLYEEQKGRCYYLDEPLGSDAQLDHFIPLARGGSDGPDNLVLSCPLCNRRKAAKMPWEFMPERFAPRAASLNVRAGPAATTHEDGAERDAPPR